jgi:hypothetical protein
VDGAILCELLRQCKAPGILYKWAIYYTGQQSVLPTDLVKSTMDNSLPYLRIIENWISRRKWKTGLDPWMTGYTYPLTSRSERGP